MPPSASPPDPTVLAAVLAFVAEHARLPGDPAALAPGARPRVLWSALRHARNQGYVLSDGGHAALTPRGALFLVRQGGAGQLRGPV